MNTRPDTACLPTGFFQPTAGDAQDFRRLVAQELDPATVPHACGIERNVPVYDMTALAPLLADPAGRSGLLCEWAGVLARSAGVVVLKHIHADHAVIDRATATFQAIIADEKARAAGKGDHFAASGANDRIWNALQKHCLRDPQGFVAYVASPAIAAIAEAWLGPDYQMTAQVNQVRPGGKAQQAHRDYHLGFQSAAQAARYPAQTHLLSTGLTLQGAIAHCDMAVESGPTKLLPFSQLYPAGYLAFHDAAHRDVFEERCIQLPLAKGDGVFFNPALFHAAGENRSRHIERMANLLQISSPFGRAMEAVDRRGMALAVFPVLRDRQQAGQLSPLERAACIDATAEGYPFPTNLDTDPPVGGNAPQSQADILHMALDENWSEQAFEQALCDLAARQAARGG